MSDEAFTQEDAGGAVIHNQLMVDGLHVTTFRKPPHVTADIVRNIPSLKIRDDDVMLCTYPKSGTNWGFEIISMLLNGKVEISPVMKMGMMLEVLPEADVEKIPSPRLLNTHVPIQWLPRQMKEKKTKIVLIVRNPKDTVVSFYYHHKGVKFFDYDGKFQDFLPLFMADKLVYNSWFDYTLEFEKVARAEPNKIHIVYFEDLKENGQEEIQKIAAFLNVAADDNLCAEINEKCSFKSLAANKSFPSEMKKVAIKDNFSLFRKGEIGDWKNHFTVAESEAFDKLFQEKMKSSHLKFRF